MSIRQGDKIISVTTPFDSAVVELVSGLNKQKQVLAQALTQKGIEVSATDTLDKMAAEIKEMDVVGAKEYIKVPFIKDYNIVSFPSKTICRQAGTQKNFIVRLTTGIVELLQAGESGDLISLASYTNPDLTVSDGTKELLWTSQNGEYIGVKADNVATDKSPINLYFLKVDYENLTISLLQKIEISPVKYVATSRSPFFYISNDGTKALFGLFFPYSSSTKRETYFIDLTQGTVESKTDESGFSSGTASASYYWIFDTPAGTILTYDRYYGGYQSSSSADFWQINIDWEDKAIIIGSPFYISHEVGQAKHIDWPCLIYEKNIVFIQTFGWESGNYPSGSRYKRDIYAYNIITNEVLDVQHFDALMFKTYPLANTSNVNFNTSFKPRLICGSVEDDKIILHAGAINNIVFNLETNKFDTEQYTKGTDDHFICSSISPMQGSNGVSGLGCASSIYQNGDVEKFVANTTYDYSSTAYGGGNTTPYKVLVGGKRQNITVGEIHQRNGKKVIFSAPTIVIAELDAGGYDVKDEVAVVDVEQ